jgi:hypothetical protein
MFVAVVRGRKINVVVGHDDRIERKYDPPNILIMIPISRKPEKATINFANGQINKVQPVLTLIEVGLFLRPHFGVRMEDIL